MNQMALDLPVPKKAREFVYVPNESRSRKDDPETSKEAAAKVGRFAANHYNKIAAALREAPGTYTEIADKCGLERHAVARRLPEMSHLGVTKTNEKRDGRTVWRIA